ncbi:MAG: hypothetical protein AAF984_06650 [Verrucomicrobiota bacterium]
MKNADRSTLMLTSLVVFVLCVTLAGVKFAVEYDKTTDRFSTRMAQTNQGLQKAIRRIDMTEDRLSQAETFSRHASFQTDILDRQLSAISSDQVKYETLVHTLRTQLILAMEDSQQLRQELEVVRQRLKTVETHYAESQPTPSLEGAAYARTR